MKHTANKEKTAKKIAEIEQLKLAGNAKKAAEVEMIGSVKNAKSKEEKKSSVSAPGIKLKKKEAETVAAAEPKSKISKVVSPVSSRKAAKVISTVSVKKANKEKVVFADSIQKIEPKVKKAAPVIAVSKPKSENQKIKTTVSEPKNRIKSEKIADVAAVQKIKPRAKKAEAIAPAEKSKPEAKKAKAIAPAVKTESQTLKSKPSVVDKNKIVGKTKQSAIVKLEKKSKEEVKPIVSTQKVKAVEKAAETESAPRKIKPKKIKPIGSAVFRGRKDRYDFQVYPLDAEFENVSAIYVISRRKTDKNKKAHHALVCIGQTDSILSEVKKHTKGKCVKKHRANVISILPEASEKRRLKIEEDLKSAHAIVCNID